MHEQLHIGHIALCGRHLLAPMAGLVSTPFRGICIAHGAAAAPTELISSTALARRNARTVTMVQRAPEERPFWVQLFGADPDIMARAAERAVTLGAEILDINMGCPVRKVARTGAGAALMQDVPRAAAIVRSVRRAVGDGIPVTAKLRSGWDSAHLNAVELARAVQDEGVAAVCVHPRTRAQAYAGKADWRVIAQVKQALDVPVIGNGDVGCVADAVRMVAETGCDGVMVGRAALGNPWIFSGLARGRDVDPSPDERTAVVLEHFARLVQQADDGKRALLRFRSRLLYYTRGLDGGVDFRRRAVSIDDPQHLLDAISAFFSSAGRARGYRPGLAGELLETE